MHLAGLNAGLQTGFTNPIDDAILAAADRAAVTGRRRLDELPYDFQRKRLRVLVRQAGAILRSSRRGRSRTSWPCVDAPTAPVAARCDIAAVRRDRRIAIGELSAQGYRVLGVATRACPVGDAPDAADEAGPDLRGLRDLQRPAQAGREADDP